MMNQAYGKMEARAFPIIDYHPLGEINVGHQNDDFAMLTPVSIVNPKLGGFESLFWLRKPLAPVPP